MASFIDLAYATDAEGGGFSTSFTSGNLSSVKYLFKSRQRPPTNSEVLSIDIQKPTFTYINSTFNQ